MGAPVLRPGLRIGRLVLVERLADTVRNNGARVQWACRCDCGNGTQVWNNNLRSGHTSSCGCLAVERVTSDTAPRRVQPHVWSAAFHRAPPEDERSTASVDAQHAERDRLDADLLARMGA